MNSLQLAIAFTLKEEGGFTIDDGGPTMHGITQSVYDAYRTSRNLLLQSVELISMAEVTDIMKSEYWIPAHCDSMPARLGIAMFDWAYNHGVTGAIITLQECLGVTPDERFGADTLNAVKHTIEFEQPNASYGLVAKFLDARRDWYEEAATVHPEKYSKYLAGWLHRVDELQTYLVTVHG